MSQAELAVNFFVALFALIDPIGNVPVFAAATVGAQPRARRLVALYIGLFSAILMMAVYFSGLAVLDFFGISLPAFRIAGGLLLFSIASEMVFGVRIERQTQQAEEALEERVRNIAAFPLAVPLMAGPGAITATVLLSGRVDHDPARIAFLLAVIVAVCAISCLCFLAATQIAKVIGHTGNTVQQRLLGVVLAALAVQYVIDGGRAALGH